MKRINILLVLIISTMQLMASGGASLEIADDLYNRLAFTKAADYYIKYLEKNEDDADIWVKLASCYDKVNDYDKLESSLKKAVENPNLTNYEALFDYAEVLQIKGDYASAITYYKKYSEKFPDNRRVLNQIKVCENVKLGQPSEYFEITNMEFNTDAFEYGPSLLRGILLYTSTSSEENASEKEHNWTGSSYSDIKTFPLTDNDFIQNFIRTKNINTPYNDGPFSIDPSTNNFYYTRNNYDPEKAFNKKGINQFNYMNLKIYIADSVLREKTTVREFPHNSDDYNVGHPAISPDGKYLVFVSDDPSENVGGRDLFYCKRDDLGEWGMPTLLNHSINTEGDELFPHFHPNGTLYFASDGLGSLGGLDIFKANIDFEYNTAEDIERLPEGLNTTYDDFGIVFKTETEGFFTSDRPDGKGKDDIYRFVDNSLLLKILVVNAENDSILPGSALKIDLAGTVLYDGVTDQNARHEIRVQRKQIYNLWADEDYFIEGVEQANTDLPNRKTTLEVKIKLQPIKYNVLVLDAITKTPIPNSVVDVNYTCQNKEGQFYTNAQGSHALEVYKSCNYQFKAKADGYLANRMEWTSTIEDKNETVVILLEKISDAPIVLRNIYYDFDKSNLRLNESFEDLEKLYTFVTDNPELTIQINSHTDARASHAYNEKLSQRRAQAVVDFLLARNIPKERLVAVGFGERVLVNNCADNVKCTEVEHQLNRRTEFQVINADGSTKIKSDSRTDISIDPCLDCPF
jgi:outer membrane protein OmpA-like peptidoglycan-associated protein